MIVWGSGLYGKVDEVPRLFHVATNFGHLYYFPLIPLGTYVILSESEGQFQGVKLPLSGKSIMLAWLRGLLVIGAIAAVFASFSQFQDDSSAGIACLVGAAAAIGAVVYSKKARGINQASYERAVQLAELLHVSDEARLMIEVAYGQMTAEEAAARLAATQPQGGG